MCPFPLKKRYFLIKPCFLKVLRSQISNLKYVLANFNVLTHFEALLPHNRPLCHFPLKIMLFSNKILFSKVFEFIDFKFEVIRSKFECFHGKMVTKRLKNVVCQSLFQKFERCKPEIFATSSFSSCLVQNFKFVATLSRTICLMKKVVRKTLYLKNFKSCEIYVYCGVILKRQLAL